MQVDYQVIGKRIQEQRKAAGLTQERMAERLDVSVGYVSQLERAITKVNLETLAKISVITGCDISYFLTGVTPAQTDYLQRELNEKFSRLTPEYKRFLLKMLNQLLELPPHK